jgi:hypothetical protein
MITKFKHSWELFKASVAVTLQHRKLLWFPFLTGLATIVISLFFLSAVVLPWALQPTGYHFYQKQHWVALRNDYFLSADAPYLPASTRSAKPPHVHNPTGTTALNMLIPGQTKAQGTSPALNRWVSLCVLLLYFPSMFLATFFNVAFYSEILAALDGRGVSFRRGLRTARERLLSILTWALLAGTVGWLIRAIEQRLPLAGRLVVGFIGLGWSIAAVFAIPVIIQEQSTRNPVTILRHSALTLKRSWGEGLVGYAGFFAGSLVIFGGSAVLISPLIIAGIIWGKGALILAALLLWILLLVSAAYLSSLARHVYCCALYKYATEGVIPEPYSQDMLDRAWKVKKTGGN